jgi:hypothetical protein
MAEGSLFLVVNSHPYMQNLNSTYQTLVGYFGENIVLLFLFTISIFLYSVFVWKFYKRLAKRDIFDLNLERYRFDRSRWVWLKMIISVVLYIVEYCILFPIYIFFWFGIITVFLFLIAKGIEVKNILLISMSLVATIRMASYYKEELSNDIAKLIPFAFLAILITDPYFFSFERVIERIYELPSLLDNLLEFVVFVFVIEGLFRFLYLIKMSFSGGSDESENDNLELDEDL